MTPGSPPRRRWRIVATTLAVLALVVAAASFALYKAFPPQRLAALLSEEVKAATGRSFEIRGDLSIQLLPTLAVVANDMTLGNADGGSRPAMATMRRAAFSVALRPLLGGRIHILRIDIEGADVLLETDASGRGNWLFAGAGPANAARTVEPGASAPQIALDKLAVADATVTYRSGATGGVRALTVKTLTVQADGERNRIAGALALDGQRWQVAGEAGRFEALAAGRADWPFDLQLQTDGATLTARGELGAGPRSGDLRLQLAARIERAVALAALGDKSAWVPLPMDVSATVAKTAHTVALDPLRLSIAGQSLAGRAAWVGGDRPHVEADLSSKLVDVGRWLPAKPAAAASSPEGAARPKPLLFGDAALPWPALPSMPVTLTLQVERLLLPNLPPLTPLALKLTSQPGRLVASPLSFGLAQGQVSAKLELALPDGGTPRATLSAQAKGLSVQELEAIAGPGGHLRGGHADLSATLTMAGATPRSLAASAHGDVLLTVARTALAGHAAALRSNVLVALLSAVLPGAGGDKALDIECAVVRLPLRDGVSHIDRSIALETDRMAVAASGELNLASQTIALSFRQEVKKGLGLNAANLAQMVSLTGPLNDPRVGVDLKGSARQVATLGLANATGGVSLLVTRLFSQASSTQACRIALGGPAATPEPVPTPANRVGRGVKSLLPWNSAR